MHYKLGLIGYPVGHSLSPWIHGEFLKRAHLTGEYEKYAITPGDAFSTEIEAFKSSGIDGFNITVPHKEAIIPFLDDLSDEARLMGAVNTVVREDNKWIGYNTDGSGYARSLHSYYPELEQHKDLKVLILGAGGAARGIYYALIATGYKYIDLANRTKESAERLTRDKKLHVRTNILTLREAEKQVADYDIIIQTSSVGMTPNVDDSIIQLAGLKEHAIVSDIVYQPLETKFLQEAKEKGARIHHGHTMLLYQAQYAFEIWTGIEVSALGMDEELKRILEGASSC